MDKNVNQLEAEMSEKELRKYFNKLTIASLCLSVFNLVNDTVILLAPSGVWTLSPMSVYFTLYRIYAFWVNPCLLLVFICTFISKLRAKKIRFKDYIGQFILYLVGTVSVAYSYWVFYVAVFSSFGEF